MRTVIVGNRKLSKQILREVLERGWNVVGAIVPEGPMATRQANFVSFDDLIAKTDCDLHTTTDINGSTTKQWLKRLNPDICICGGWSQIINGDVLDIPNTGFFGLHASDLPKGRGGAPVNWRLINGSDEVSLSLFFYDKGVDSGDVVAKTTVPIENRDDVGTVFDRLAREARQLVSSQKRVLEGDDVPAQPQSLADATYRPRRQPQDGLIDWTHPSTTQHNWIRAQTRPYPGAYTFHDGERLTVWRGEPRPDYSAKGVPGEVLKIVDGDGVDVQTKNGIYRITRIQIGTSAPQWADEYARDRAIKPGTKFGRIHAPKDWIYTGMAGLLGEGDFDTNLRLEESGSLEIVSYAGSKHELEIRVSADDKRIFDEQITVGNRYRQRVNYSFRDVGTHSVRVTFKRNGEHIDKRYLKVFVSE